MQYTYNRYTHIDFCPPNPLYVKRFKVLKMKSAMEKHNNRYYCFYPSYSNLLLLLLHHLLLFIVVVTAAVDINISASISEFYRQEKKQLRAFVMFMFLI